MRLVMRPYARARLAFLLHSEVNGQWSLLSPHPACIGSGSEPVILLLMREIVGQYLS